MPCTDGQVMTGSIGSWSAEEELVQLRAGTSSEKRVQAKTSLVTAIVWSVVRNGGRLVRCQKEVEERC